MSEILGRLTKAQRRITVFVFVTGQKLYTVGVALPASVVQLACPFHPTCKYTLTHTGYNQPGGSVVLTQGYNNALC